MHQQTAIGSKNTDDMNDNATTKFTKFFPPSSHPEPLEKTLSLQQDVAAAPALQQWATD